MARPCLSFILSLKPLVHFFSWDVLSMSLSPSIARIYRKEDRVASCLHLSKMRRIKNEIHLSVWKITQSWYKISSMFYQNPCSLKCSKGTLSEGDQRLFSISNIKRISGTLLIFLTSTHSLQSKSHSRSVWLLSNC